MHKCHFFPNYQINSSNGFSKYRLQISSCQLQTQDSIIMLYAATHWLLPYSPDISFSEILKSALKSANFNPVDRFISTF